jgi:putative DNA primase/helicase
MTIPFQSTTLQEAPPTPPSPPPTQLPNLGPSPDRYAFTDLGNAQRLVARHGKDLHYCPAWRKWLIWDGKRWNKDDTGEILRRAKETIRAFHLDALDIQDSGQRGQAVKHALKSQYEGRLTAMVGLAESEPGIPVRPNDLDRDPYLLNCSNGTVELKTGTLRNHRPEDLITKLAPVTYVASAECPVFKSFLWVILDGDKNLISYLKRVVGYALTGDVAEKAIFFLYGDGNNGKTTFLETVRAMLGDYAGQIPIESLMVKQGDGISNDIACLQGLRFVTSSEAEQGKKLAEPKVKQITGMGKLKARFLYGEFFEFDPTFKIFMDANHKPEIRGTDSAIWNRIKLIPFTVEIAPEQMDKKLLQKLKAELPGILAWAVQGGLNWQKSGLAEPKAVTAATQGYREEMDTVGRFLEEECDLGGDYDTTSKALYDAYKKWCQDRQEEPVSAKQLGSALRKKGLQDTKVDRQRGWHGINFKMKGPLFVGNGDT